MTDTTYNGWTNRETWLVNLWLGEEDFIGNQQDGRTEPVAEFAVKFYLRQWVQNQYAVHAQIPREFGFVQDMAGAVGCIHIVHSVCCFPFLFVIIGTSSSLSLLSLL